MMKTFDVVRHLRSVGAAVVLVGLAASIAGCAGNGPGAPSSTTTTTTTTTGSSGAPGTGAPAEPSNKAPRIDPGGPNVFTPTLRAPAAPTAIPGNRENTG